MKTIILLYYRAPYEDEPELICACDSEQAAQDRMYALRARYPDAYSDIYRFETNRIELFSRGGIQ